MIGLIRRLLLVLFVVAPLVATATSYASVCKDLVLPRLTAESIRLNKAQFFNAVADAIIERKDALRKILLRANNHAGTELEFDIVIRQLRNAENIELYNLDNTRALENVTVYAATNVPLYTLISHGIIPLSVAKNVWFRTPEMTRTVYLDLYTELANAIPQIAGLHMLHSNRDVQYDNFNKIHVLGMNQDGTYFKRQPSEMVIFTGNPGTAHEILRRNEARVNRLIESLGERMPDFKQVFLGFGAGINPMVITSSASRDLKRVVYQSLEPVRINNAQDCMAPDFYAVHSSVSKRYIAELLNQVRAMKIGEAADPSAAITPLQMAKNFDRLVEYKNKYQQYLVNTEATIDPTTKIITPHVFEFPISMFHEVSIQEHFGPFFTVFRYDNYTDLKMIATDDRVQRKAMYATVLGGPKATSDITDAADVFRQNKHFVSINETLFGDIDANLPFGGRGSDASIVAIMDVSKTKGVQLTSGNRPKLFSSEAQSAFGTSRITPKPSVLQPSAISARLRRLVERAKLETRFLTELSTGWTSLIEPLKTLRRTGLEYLRQVIAQEGLYLFLDKPRPSPKIVSDLEYLYGAKIIFAGDYPIRPKRVPRHRGVVLHSADVGAETASLNAIRGRVNPHLGFGHLQGLLDGNKLAEYYMTEAIVPGLMARTESIETLSTAGILTPSFEQARIQAMNNLNAKLQTKTRLTPAEREALTAQLTQLMTEFLSQTRAHYPEGAFIKNYGDFGTADMGTQITTFSKTPKSIAAEFLRRFEMAMEAVGRQGIKMHETEFRQELNTWEMSSMFMHVLFTNPNQIMLQSRVNIARTEMGFPFEFRVDFMDGDPVHGRLRFGNEYYPEEIANAMQVVKDFFAKAPPELRHLSGGADVARLADGTWTVFEWNIGSTSGTLEPGYFPIENGLLMSNLIGKRTAFIQDLEQVYQSGVLAQREYLKALKFEAPQFWKPDLSYLSRAEVGKWFRDRHLEDWARNPTRESVPELLKNLETLFEGVVSTSNEDIPKLMTAARHFVQRTLRRP